MYNLCTLICTCTCTSNRIRVYFTLCMDMKCSKENLKWHGCNLFYEAARPMQFKTYWDLNLVFCSIQVLGIRGCGHQWGTLGHRQPGSAGRGGDQW